MASMCSPEWWSNMMRLDKVLADAKNIYLKEGIAQKYCALRSTVFEVKAVNNCRSLSLLVRDFDGKLSSETAIRNPKYTGPPDVIFINGRGHY